MLAAELVDELHNAGDVEDVHGEHDMVMVALGSYKQKEMS